MSRKKLAWANKEVETFVCILGEEDVVYDVYVAAAAIDIRPTTKGREGLALLAHLYQPSLGPSHLLSVAWQRTTDYCQSTTTAGTWGTAAMGHHRHGAPPPRGSSAAARQQGSGGRQSRETIPFSSMLQFNLDFRDSKPKFLSPKFLLNHYPR
ncbi:unnamed protein product [Boreogadus saida]